MTVVRVVVMGVSGCGKSTVGRLLADSLAAPFVEGDDLHPPHNVALMAAGTPLTDDDRAEWLRRVAAALHHAAAQAHSIVISCSALKRAYRDTLRQASPGLRFVYLKGSRELLTERLQARAGHYMPASLLQSQLDTLEPPSDDEHAVTLDIQQSPAALAAAARQALLGPP